MRPQYRPITYSDIPKLAAGRHTIFRLRPRMTSRKFEKDEARGISVLQSNGYEVPAPFPVNGGFEPPVLCRECNHCLITGSVDRESFKPFGHWCCQACVKVNPDGGCKIGRRAWGPIIQVLNGRMD